MDNPARSAPLPVFERKPFYLVERPHEKTSLMARFREDVPRSTLTEATPSALAVFQARLSMAATRTCSFLSLRNHLPWLFSSAEVTRTETLCSRFSSSMLSRLVVSANQFASIRDYLTSLTTWPVTQNETSSTLPTNTESKVINMVQEESHCLNTHSNQHSQVPSHSSKTEVISYEPEEQA